MKNIELTVVIDPTTRDGWHKDAVNWVVTLSNGRYAFSTPYSEGMGHFINLPYGQRHTLDVEAVYNEIKSGKDFATIGHQSYLYKHLSKRVSIKNGMAKITPPQSLDVLRCLAMDALALPQTFEDWASEYGYEVDSRKAYETWQQCCDTARQLYALGLSDDDLQALRDEE